MKKYYYILAAVASLGLASCNNDIAPVADDVAKEDAPITFNSFKGAFTRADKTGEEAAELLGKKFVVSGYKGSKTAEVGGVVFDNYAVTYADGSAYTTGTNTKNWEYVGIDPIKHAEDNGIQAQTIKYWDYSKPQYDFVAWSTGDKTAIYEGEPADGQVLVSAIDPSSLGATYTFKGKAADLAACYISNITTVKKDAYDNPVTLRFRSLGTKVRVAIYETIPGYSVKDVKFYSAADATTGDAASSLFATTAGSIYTAGTYTVSYPTVDNPADADNNQAHVAFAGEGTQESVVSFGNLNLTAAELGEKTSGDAFLGRTSNAPSYAGAAADDYYTVYLPNEDGAELNLRVDYTLESTDGSGETIEVTNATAKVPAGYTAWKPGFAYTYIFKISDQTNGKTSTDDTDPSGLYPITFDAVVTITEDGVQETISVVDEPGIITYAEGKVVTVNNEYTTGTAIYASGVNADGSTSSDVALYIAELTGSHSAITDATAKLAYEQGKSDPSSDVYDKTEVQLTQIYGEAVTSVPAVDGNTLPVNAVKFTPTTAGTYVLRFGDKVFKTIIVQ